MLARTLSAGPTGRVQVRCTDRGDGDFHVAAPEPALTERRSSVAPGEWTWLRQVHGPRIVEVDQPGAQSGVRADGSFTAVVGAVLAVQTADCAPVVIAGDGVVGVAHAGWRGIVEGVLPALVGEMRANGAGSLHALLGPCIRPQSYEFGAAELAEVVAIAGPSVVATASSGRPALDMGAAVAAVLDQCGVDGFEDLGVDTAGDRYFSHRCRTDPERQVTVAWLETT